MVRFSFWRTVRARAFRFGLVCVVGREITLIFGSGQTTFSWIWLFQHCAPASPFSNIILRVFQTYILAHSMPLMVNGLSSGSDKLNWCTLPAYLRSIFRYWNATVFRPLSCGSLSRWVRRTTVPDLPKSSATSTLGRSLSTLVSRHTN